MDKGEILLYEAGVVGSSALNIRPDAVQYAKARLTPECFSNFSHTELFRCLLKANDHNHYLTLLAEKGLAVKWAEANRSVYAVPSLLEYNVDRLVAINRAQKIRADMTKLLQTPDDELPETLLQYTSKLGQQDEGKLEDLPKRQVAEVIKQLGEPDLEERIKTGIPKLDWATSGLRKGNVSILGALPSAGKTAFAMNIVRHCTNSRKRVVVFSLEMGVTQLWERLLADLASIPYGGIAGGKLKDNYRQTAKELLEVMQDYPLYFFDNVLSVEGMAEHVMRLKPDFVVVDFLQYVKVISQRHNSVADRLEYIMGEFKALAKLPYCRCHIMLLSQHSRESKTEGGSMFSLKGSSGIEQGGDYIMILDRPHVRDNKVPPEMAKLQLAKNKFGRLANIDLYFEGDFQRFRELAAGERYPNQEPQKWIGEGRGW